jgi:tetratricopeptide (TPR) repeat protein
MSQYLEAIRLKPDFARTYNPTLLNNLAWALATSPDASKRNGTRAVQLAERACDLTHYSQPIMVGTLAAAYAEAGRFDDAVATAQKARDAALALGQKEIADNNERLLELYKSGRAFHRAAAGAP